MPGGRVQVAMVGEHADQHNRARDRERHAENDASRPAPAKQARDDGSERRGSCALRDRPGNGDAPHGKQFFHVKLKAHAEHQEDDPDLGELFGDFRVGDKPGSMRANQRAGNEVADDRGEPGALREVTQDQGGRKAARKRQDQIQVVHEPIVLRRLARLLAKHALVPPRGEERSEDGGDNDRRGDLHGGRFGNRRVGRVCHGDGLGYGR